jgi:lipoprotein-anchoring transpeptidase ErfK/SrfK
MAKGRHVHRRRFGVVAVLATAMGVVLLAAAGGAFAAYRYERARAHRILPGVTIAGVDVSDMTRAEAVAAVREVAARTLGAPLVASVDGRRWKATPAELGERAGVGIAVDQALATTGEFGTFDRFWHRVRDESIGVSIDLEYRTKAHGVQRFVDRIADDVFVPARDAEIGITDDGNALAFTHAKAGQKLDVARALDVVKAALARDRTRVGLRMRPVRADITQDSIGPTIVVRVDRNRLDLYDGFDRVRSWSVATAKPGYTTPVGVWNIYDKRENPAWYNPALDSWGAALPAVIPGGPGNPMGTRAIYIDAPGLIRVHGTTDDSSIGRYASHGCIRMHNEEVEALFEEVPVGSHVVIVGHRPPWAQEWDTPTRSDI